MEVLLAEQQHGVKNMLALLEKAAVGVVVLSPQSRAALCKELGLTPMDLMFKLEVFLKKFNSSLLLDLQFFIDLHQNLHYIEIQQSKSKPVITSECPGWICYVEKIVKEPLIKLCSRIKSPMMLAGDIVRKLFSLAGLVGLAHQSQESIALVGVAPCHDKKLETFRPETATGSTG
jgi:iron only hydrogenase large subunit-like protein